MDVSTEERKMSIFDFLKLKVICSACLEVGIENEVLGKKFYYCRSCKEEIPQTPEDDPTLWGQDGLYGTGLDEDGDIY